MPYFKIVGDKIAISSTSREGENVTSLAASLANLQTEENPTDVIFHCKNKKKVSANKIVLLLGSKLLRQIFTDFNSQQQTYDLVCPEFNVEAVQRILDLLYTGSTWIGCKDNAVFEEMREIIVTLGINYNMLEFDSFQTQVPFDDINSTSEDMIFEATPSTDPKTMFSCNFCSAVFTVSFALSKHVKKHVASKEKSKVGILKQGPSLAKKRVTFDLTIYESPKFTNENLPSPDSNDDVTDENLSNDSETMSEDSFEDYVGVCCRYCDELYRKKDLVEHEEKCKNEKNSTKEDDEEEKSKNGSTVSEPDVNGNAERNCFICGYKTTYKSNFFRHFVTHHYSERLDDMFGPFNKVGCSICSKKMGNEKAWKCHLLMAHNVLPMSANEKKTAKVPNKTSLNKLKIKIKGKKSTIVMACTKSDVIEKDESYYCPKCPAVACRYTTLVRHLTLAHYRPELKPHVKNGDNGNDYNCGFCDKAFRAKTGVYLHVARAHNVPSAFIPKPFSLTKKTFKI